MLKGFFFSLISSVIFNSFGAPLYRPAGHTLDDDTYEINLDVSLWQTSSRFNTDGQEVQLNEGDSFMMIDTNAQLIYGFNKNLSAYGGGRFRQISTEYSSGGQDFSVTESGVESYHLGFLYAMKDKGRFRYNLDAQFGGTIYTNTEYETSSVVPNEEVVLGDSGSRYQVGVNASYLWDKDLYLNGSVFYHQPPNDLSAEIVWSADTTWLWEKWHLSLGADGVYSLNGDAFTDNPNDKVIQGRAPTALFNSINRAWLQPKAGLYYSFGSWRIGAEVSSRISGVSTDKGNQVVLSLSRATRGKTVTQIKKEKFKEYRIEGTVLKVSPRGRYVQIDQGLTQDVEKGMVFDVFKTDYFGGNELIASAIAHEVGLEKAILKVVKLHSKEKVQKGYVARSQ